MATPNDALGFFVLEAGECLERLDATLASAGATGPDAAEFVRHARTLRGAALMHRLSTIADLAGAVERAGRALRDGNARWSAAVAAALVAAVDDLKILLHNLRLWGPNEEARAARRLADLARTIPASADERHGSHPTPIPGAEGGASPGLAFLARAAIETSSALDALETTPPAGAAAALEAALVHVRTLRGVATVHDVPPIAEVLDTVDRAARMITAARAVPSTLQLTLFAASAALLRRTATDLQSHGQPQRLSTEERRFQAARDALMAATSDADRIPPISELFYEGEREGVVTRASSPPTSPGDRFRLEVVSLAEHLRGVVRETQGSGPGPLSDRAVADLRATLQSIRRAAESFGEHTVAQFIATFTDGHPVFDFLTVNAIDDLGTLLTQPMTGDELAARMAQLAEGQAVDAGIAQGLRDAPAPSPAQHRGRAPLSRDRARTPTGPQLQALLADGIAGFSPLGDLPLIDNVAVLVTTPTDVPTMPSGAGGAPGDAAAGQGLVPIESLLYRGESALARARTLRDSLRAQGTPLPDALAELYDMLDLATPS